jgi:hypothetical protein
MNLGVNLTMKSADSSEDYEIYGWASLSVF